MVCVILLPRRPGVFALVSQFARLMLAVNTPTHGLQKRYLAFSVVRGGDADAFLAAVAWRILSL